VSQGQLQVSVAQFAEQLDDALAQHTADIASLRAANWDFNTQLGAMNISLLAVRNEVLQRIDTCERKVLVALEDIKQLLLSQKGRHG